MAKQKFSISALKDFDMGKVEIAFRREIAQAVEDIANRPHIPGERKAILAIIMSPGEIMNTQLETVSTRFEVSHTTPKRSSAAYSMAYQKGGQLLFNAESLDDAKQHTLDEMIVDKQTLELRQPE